MPAYTGAPDAVDFSFDRVSGATLAKAGIKLAARYLSHTPKKNLTADEATDLRSHGVGVLLNWESGAGRPLLGSAAGAADAADACLLAGQIGAPRGCTIYYSCDRDVNASQYDAIANYYTAAKHASAGRYRVGVYGEFEIVEELHRRGVVDGEWQTYAWSGGRLSIQSDLYQYLNSQRMAGAAVDYDHIIHAADLGAWWPAGSANNIGEDIVMDPATKDYFDEKFADQKKQISAAVDQLREQTHAAAVQDAKRDAALAGALDSNQAELVSDISQIVAAGGDPTAVAEAVVSRIGQILQGAA